MATASLMSSPIGPTSKYDIFDRPSSPTFKHDDLPAEFGERSFGSSMSLGSSFEVAGSSNSNSSSQLAALASEQEHSSPITSGQASRARSNSSQMNPSFAAPRLGAAMGTTLNAKSPGLAAKMSSSSPHYMDISPAPSRAAAASQEKNNAGSTPTSSSGKILPPGSAMKEDTPTKAMLDALQKKASDSITQGPYSTGSLGRLFGTELSINDKKGSHHKGHFADESSGLESSPDKEPPAKRRPSSLPTSHPGGQSRASLRSVGMGPTSSSVPKRPSLLKSMTGPATEGLTKGKRRSSEALRQQHRVSDPTVPTTKSFALGKPLRSRSGSSERLRADAFDGDGKGSSQRSSLPPSHPTIIESPSPSSLANEDLGSYFHDPHSPEQNRLAAPERCSSSQQSLASVFSGSVEQHPPRPRVFAKAASSAVVPSLTSGTVQQSAKSSLGKRSNPYSKRPNLSVLQNGSLQKSVHPTMVGAAPGRMTAPAPRRCQSAIDNSAAFMQGEDVSMMSGSSVEGNDSSILADTSSPDVSRSMMGRTFPEGFDASGSPVAPSAKPKARPGIFRRPSKDDSSPLGYGMGKRKDGAGDGITLGQSPMANGSPYGGAEGLPGFGASEREGKILPCFNVKDDGLMRITSETLVDVLNGQFDNQMDGYVVIDCRFGYEFEGGHVPGAINLSTMERVKNFFLQPGQGLHAGGKALPLRTQSGKADKDGKVHKRVLIFHCEFSCKRAPSMALALRQADRALAQDYPYCHFPEVYILQDGYCNFFKQYRKHCEPQNYVQMDDPKFQDRRSTELNGFRKQFARHRSFTYGDAMKNPSSSSIGNPSFVKEPRPAAIKEEDSSFDSSNPRSSAGGIATGTRRNANQNAGLGTTANMATSGVLHGLKPGTLNLAGGNGGETGGDISWSSSVGDSSFEGGPSESPCAAAGSRKPSVLIAGPSTSSSRNGSLGRQPLQRASTASNVLR